MDKLYSYVANSNVMLLFCGLAIIAVMIQSVIFFRMAWKRALELKIDKSELKKIVKSSAVFSIVPSLPILISYVILLPVLGKYFPWLRLSIIGSAAYETMSANMAVTAFGFESLGNANFNANIFGSLMWVMTLGVFLSSMSVVVLRKYDTKIQSVTNSGNPFGTVVPNIMFLGMLSTLSAPYLVDITNIPSVATIVSSAGTMILLDKIGEKHKAVKEFAFAVSMIVGMSVACIVSALI